MSLSGLSGSSVCSSSEKGSWGALPLTSPRLSRVGDTDLALFVTVVDTPFWASVRGQQPHTVAAGGHKEANRDSSDLELGCCCLSRGLDEDDNVGCQVRHCSGGGGVLVQCCSPSGTCVHIMTVHAAVSLGDKARQDSVNSVVTAFLLIYVIVTRFPCAAEGQRHAVFRLS